jgi:hypothetical protein
VLQSLKQTFHYKKMKRNVTLIGDVLACLILIEWFRLGLWINLLGFSFYHSRGDVWLPTPPAAVNFLTGMVLIATLLFATFFLLTSCLIFFLGRSSRADNARGWLFLSDAFYGDGHKLAAKYFAFSLGSIIEPFAVSSMWKVRPTRLFSISTALGIMLVAFVVIVFIAAMLLARSHPRPMSANHLSVNV